MGHSSKKGVLAGACAVALAGVLCVGCSAGGQGDQQAGDSGESGAPAASAELSALTNGITDEQEVVYCLYLGLNDKDTGKQELSMDEAKKLVVPLFLEAGSGYTVYEAEGGYATEDGTVVQNDTLVFDSVHGSEQAVLDLIDELKQTLNIESVYCESKVVGFKMYGGVIGGVE